ncbi:hypothetical protein GBAR_LOCUS5680 [Geodia barretti]|uniref:Uncharacterized protein n=1 Tax=Geodia barretti TaxID=519541 RepID=A0AA35RDS3_GEOBA|nr:hypothetical protein GBAR_LOCUS5680 [Geodia barretti]
MPAVVLENLTIINSGMDVMRSPNTSQILKSGNISRKSMGRPLLTVVDMPHLLHFPVSLAVDSPENYTFALFGKHPVTGMEEQPLLTLKLSDMKEEETVNGDRNDDMKETVNGKRNVENSQTEVVVISTGTAVVGCVLGCGSAVLVLVVVKQLRRRSKSRNAAPQGSSSDEKYASV